MTQIPHDETTLRITGLADYMMRRGIDLLTDAEMNGPCQNKVWYTHIQEILDELRDCLEELHTWKEAKR